MGTKKRTASPCAKECGRNTTRDDGVCVHCKSMTPCEKCKKPRGSLSNRFCAECAKQIKSELESSGFLQKVPYSKGFRPNEAAEDSHSTKFGTGHG